MKWTFIIQQKFKVVALLTAMIVLIGVTNYMEQQNIDEMDKSFNSIYYDRLIPAAEVFHMTQNLYKMRLLLESALHSGDPVSSDLDEVLEDLIRNTEARIAEFEKTFLVARESDALVNFKRGMSEYESAEAEVVTVLQAGKRDEAFGLYTKQLLPKFSQMLGNLEELSSIQTSVGKDILEQSRNTVSSSSIVLTLQIVSAIIIGAMTYALIIASKAANVKASNVHLN